MLIARFISLAEKLCHLYEIQVRVARYDGGERSATNPRCPAVSVSAGSKAEN